MRPARWLVASLALSTAGCAIPRWPVDAPLMSPFGLRMRGIRPDLHRGVDLGVPGGTPVKAMAPGRVRFAGVQSGYGNVVWLDHGGAVLTVYAHLSRVEVRTGGAVRGGEVIGLSGSSGDVTAPHLHFEIWRWGREVDPVLLLGGRPHGLKERESLPRTSESHPLAFNAFTPSVSRGRTSNRSPTMP